MNKNEYLSASLMKFKGKEIWIDGWLPELSDVGDDYFVCRQNDEERFYSFESVKCVREKGDALNIYVEEPTP